MTPIFFASPEAFRDWLEANGARETELWVGFHKKGTGRPSMTWREAVDQALCFGWIDGVRQRIDDQSYANRFTPRRARSVWSAVNIKCAEELIAAGQMRPAGHDAFARRDEERSAIYAYEQRHTATLGEDFAQQLRANDEAWAFFQAQPASYRQAAIWWVVSAKKDETKRRRLANLIADSAAGRTAPPLTRR